MVAAVDTTIFTVGFGHPITPYKSSWSRRKVGDKAGDDYADCSMTFAQVLLRK